MRVLLVNQFYPPDLAPTGRLLHDVARALRARGHDVSVVCSRQTYAGEERFEPWQDVEGVGVHRVRALGLARSGIPGRLADAGWFAASLTTRALVRVPRPDLIVCLTSPPYLGLWGAGLGALRGAAVAHWVMDVYPDALAASSLLRPGGAAWRVLNALARLQFRSAKLVLSLGPRVQERLTAYVSPGTRAEWVAPWASAEPADPAGVAKLRTSRGFEPGEVVLQYSGNLGRGHRFDEFLAAAERLGASGPWWAFAGKGPRRGELESASRRLGADGRIRLLDYVPREQLGVHLAAADVHLASLEPEWKGLIVPSKVVAALAAGRPVLFVGPPDSEAAHWIRESGAGWVVAPGCVDALVDAVSAACDPAERARRGHAGQAYAERLFDPVAGAQRVVALLEECVAADPGTLRGSGR